MTKKIKVPSELNVQRNVVIHGNLVRGSLSPLDVPTEATAEYNGEEKSFILKFSYPDPAGRPMERPELANESDNVSIYVGKESGRLFRVEISGIEDKSQIPNIVIEAVIHVQKEATESATKWLNFAMVKDFVDRKRSEIAAITG